MSDEIIYTGQNEADVRAFLAHRFARAFPDDWVEEMPDGSLLIMGADEILFLERGQSLRWNVDRPILK